jgi:hypothetical protein
MFSEPYVWLNTPRSGKKDLTHISKHSNAFLNEVLCNVRVYLLSLPLFIGEGGLPGGLLLMIF